MNVNLKKIKILEPKVKITTELKTISREPSGNTNIVSYNAIIINNTAGYYICGNAEPLEV